jgi:hypothetical protein
MDLAWTLIVDLRIEDVAVNCGSCCSCESALVLIGEEESETRYSIASCSFLPLPSQ